MKITHPRVIIFVLTIGLPYQFQFLFSYEKMLTFNILPFRKNIHGINANSLRKMLERYEKSVTIDSIMKSVRQETIVKSPYDKGENFERYPKFKAKEKDECPSSESENENLLQFASDVNSKIRRPIATKKNFLSSNVPETFHTSKCSVDAGKLEGFSKKSPQLITSTLGGKVDVEKIQRDKLESVELELGSAEVNDVVDEHSKCSKPTVSEGNLLRAENTLDKSEDWCSKGGLVSNIQSINSNKCTDEVTRAQDSSEIKMPKLCEDVLDRIIPQSGDLSQGEILDSVNEESNVMLSRNSCLLDKSASTESEATVGGDHSEPQSTSSLSPEKSITGDYSSISAGDTEILVQKNQVTLGTSTVPLISGGYVEVSEDNSENVEDGEVKQSKEIQESGVVSPEATVMVDNDPSIGKIQVENDSSDYSILKAHSQTGDFQPVLKEEIQDIEKMFDSSEEYKVETTDLGKENNDSMDTMKFLEDCFPHVDISLLRSSLDTCRGDLVKTVDYLLKYSDNSDQENISGCDDGFVKESTSETVGTTPQNSSRTPTPTGQVIHSNHAEYLGRKELKDIETMESEIVKEIQDNSSVKSNSTAVHSSANGFQDISFTSLNLTLDPALALQLLEIFGSFSGINPKGMNII